MGLEKVNLAEKLAQFADYWNPRVVGEVNGQLVKLAKLEGEFIWHHHADADELFLVLSGALDIQLRERVVHLEAGEFFVVPKGVEHRPVARERAEVVLIEPASTLNTGNVRSERTVDTPEKI